MLWVTPRLLGCWPGCLRDLSEAPLFYCSSWLLMRGRLGAEGKLLAAAVDLKAFMGESLASCSS